MANVKKVMLIGWDGAPPQMIKLMIEKGLLRNFAGLMERGTFIYALNPYPTITASNWMTLSTGAWPGRHGVTGYNVHHPGEPLDKIYSGFNTAECSAEYIWDSAEKIGKRCILVHYETSWPPTPKTGIVVGGCGPNYQDEFHKIAPDIVFSTETYPGMQVSDPVEISEVNGKYTAFLKFRTASDEEKTYYAVWTKGEKTLYVFKDKSEKAILSVVKEGNWSGPAYDKFLFEGEKVDTAFRFKLLHLPDAQDDEFKLLCTSIMPVRQFTSPQYVGAELIDKLGPYYPRGGWESARAVGPETYLEYLDMYHDWLAGACQYLMNKEDWDLLYAQTHCHDYVHHLFMRCYDPITAGTGRWSQEQCESYMDRAYESADRMLGKIIECADDETLIVVVSDHGATAWLADVNIRQILVDKGLMTVEPETGQVIWEKTKAVPQRACYIYVNVKGRDPQGIVEPGEEYETVRDQIIEAFYDYTEPETNRRPFSLVLRREDARVLGLYGPRVGDIVYALNTQYGHEHGQGLPTARLGRGSLEAVILLAGPGIKRGVKLEGVIGIQDVVPTLCYMADIPFPQGCEGAIIYGALVDPSFKMKEKAKLEKELEKWKDAYEKQVSITHSRF
jgi:predicted AlkP superfamily phosphohydrolase/phosphomutase